MHRHVYIATLKWCALLSADHLEWRGSTTRIIRELLQGGTKAKIFSWRKINDWFELELKAKVLVGTKAYVPLCRNNNMVHITVLHIQSEKIQAHA